MKTYDVTVAGDVSCYANMEIEAESLEAAIEQARERFDEADIRPDYSTGTENRRIVDVCDGETGETLAEDIDIDEPDTAPSHLHDSARIVMALANLLSEIRTDLTERGGVVASVSEIVDKIDDVLGPFQDAMEEAAQAVMRCIIVNDAGDFWNNEIGWVSNREAATRFSDDERASVALPMGGRWEGGAA